MRFKKHAVTTVMAAVLGIAVVLPDGNASHYESYYEKEKEITLIHMGDLHGHTIPRPNLRSDGDGKMEGGLARMYSIIKKIRKDEDNTLLINTGDTTQGSGEALYTRGKALVDIVDMFGVDAFAAGNWEFVYGPQRFEEFFGAGTGKNGVGNRWGALAANLYRTNPDAASAGIPPTLARVHTQAQYDAWANWYLNNGQRILPPYAVKNVGGVKVGIIGCTTRRGPQVVGSWVVDGIEFTDCANEVQKYATELRDPAGPHNVDLLVLITEIEVGVNIQMVRTLLGDSNHVDVILNSDMHEETLEPLQITNKDGVRKTLLLEQGMDGTMLGELELEIRNKKITEWEFKAHRIHEGITEDYAVAKKVAAVRAPFTTQFDSSIPCNSSSPYYNTFSGTCLNGSLDTVVGRTEVGLHRSNYSDEDMPAVLEGTSHDFIADAIRWWAGSDIATVRGFRYGTHVKPGPITRNDLYHFIPIGARVGKASRIHMHQIRNQVDNSSQAVFSSDPISALVRAAPYNNNGWAGGWMFAYSGEQFSVKFDPYGFRVAPSTSRARELKVAMPCNRLHALEQAATGCSGQDLTLTQITNGTNGAWMTNWNQSISPAVVTYALQTDPPGADTWAFAPTSPPGNNQNRLPMLAVAGYWYEQSPFKLNNCPNCNPVGLSNDDRNSDAPYILPVNEGPDGKPYVYTDGKPKLLDKNGDVIDTLTDLQAIDPNDIMRDSERRPIAAGKAIELVTVIEKYLDHLMTTTGRGADPVQHRVTLVEGVTLPGRDVFGHPVMQPLCGTIPETTTFAASGVTEATTDLTDYRTFQCWKDDKIITR